MCAALLSSTPARTIWVVYRSISPLCAPAVTRSIQAAPVEQFIITGVAGAELEMSHAGIREVARFCEMGREALKGKRAQRRQQRLPVGVVAVDRRCRGGGRRRHATDRHGLLAARLPQGVVLGSDHAAHSDYRGHRKPIYDSSRGITGMARQRDNAPANSVDVNG